MKLYITIFTIDKSIEVKREYKAFATESDALAYVLELGEKYAPLAEYGHWECNEEWDDTETKKLGFDYYIEEPYEQSISCKMVEGEYVGGN